MHLQNYQWDQLTFWEVWNQLWPHIFVTIVVIFRPHLKWNIMCTVRSVWKGWKLLLYCYRTTELSSLLFWRIHWQEIVQWDWCTNFFWQRIGYSAASQSFHAKTDVLMLTTNMIRKDLGSQTMYDSGIALNGLSCFMTPDLARDLVNDILSLVSKLTGLPFDSVNYFCNWFSWAIIETN